MNKDYQNYYELLEIAENATRKEIIQAYQKAKTVYGKGSMALYPLYSNNDSDDILVAVEEAYKILTNPERRELYDQQNSLNQSKATVRISYDKPGYMKRTLLDIPSFLSEDVNVTGSKKYILKNKDKSKGAEEFKIDTPLFETNIDFERKIAGEKDFFGSFLKEVREYKNITYNFIASKTKISSLFIKNIEEENFEDFPARVYLLGFLKSYVTLLGLTNTKAVESYMKRYDARNKN